MYWFFSYNPLVGKTPAFLKDLKIEADVLLVTADISSLYTISPQQMGYQASR